MASGPAPDESDHAGPPAAWAPRLALPGDASPTMAPAPLDTDDQATLPPTDPRPPLSAEETATRPPSGAAPGPAQASGFPRVPGYEILSVLGQGGMGVVYKARHAALHRLVAMKMIRGSFVERAEQRQRFLLEAEAVARLQHANIVQIFEIGDVTQSDGCAAPFMALEFIEGPNLELHLQGKPVTAAAAAELVADLARAMAFAHERNIIHRDLKPANVLLQRLEDRGQKTEDGGKRLLPSVLRPLSSFSPKITDFGLAKQIDTASSQTKAGEIMGTPSYMAPEQAEARPDIGPAADIYALGAILYEALTGRPPFRAATSLDTIFQVLGQEPVAPSRLQPGVPRDVETICLKCMEKVPAKRYPSAAELADDLDRFLAGEPIRARPVGVLEKAWKWAKRRPSAAALVAVSAFALVALLAGGVWFNHTVRIERDAAVSAEAEAKAAKAFAEEKARESQKSLDQLALANGVRIADGGDLFAGLSWFTRPLDPAVVYRTHERINRDRIVYYLAYSSRPTLRHTLWHKEAVAGAAFSPDGRLIATASSDHTGQVWDVETGAAVGSPLQHTDRVYQALFSPDSRLVLTLSADKTAHLWDARTGRSHAPPMTHDGEVVGGEFRPDGRLILTYAAEDKRIHLWNAVTGQPAGEPIGLGEEVNFATFDPDGRTIVAATGKKGAKTGSVEFLDLATRTSARPAIHLDSAAVHVAFAPGGNRAAVVCASGAVRIWSPNRPDDKPIEKWMENVKQIFFTSDGRRIVPYAETRKAVVWDAVTGKQVGSTIETPEFIHTIDVSPDGRYLATGGDDKRARVWNLETGQPVTPLLPQRHYINSIAFSPDGRCILTASSDGTARLWDLATDQPTPAVAFHKKDYVYNFAVSPDGRRIITAGGDKTVGIWDARTAKPVHPRLVHPDLVKEVRFSPDGTRIASACRDGIIRLWDAADFKLVRELKGHEKIVTTIQYNAVGDSIYSTSFDGTARIWNAASGQCRAVLKHGGPVIHGELSPDGTLFVTCGEDSLVCVWVDLGGGLYSRAAHDLRGHSGPVVHGAFSPDGRQLATTSWDYSTRVWDTTTWNLHCPPLLHDGAMWHVAFSRDGRRLATASEDNSARLWDVETGRAVAPPLMHPAWALDAEFSRDGDRVMTAMRRAAARIWNAETGQPMSPFIVHPSGRILQAVYKADETHFIATGSDGGLFIWPIPNDSRPTEDLIHLTEAYFGYRLDTFGGFSAMPLADHQAIWKDIAARYPADFSVSTQSRLAWHRREMAAAAKEHKPWGVALHFLHAFPEWSLLLSEPRLFGPRPAANSVGGATR